MLYQPLNVGLFLQQKNISKLHFYHERVREIHIVYQLVTGRTDRASLHHCLKFSSLAGLASGGYGGWRPDGIQAELRAVGGRMLWR